MVKNTHIDTTCNLEANLRATKEGKMYDNWEPLEPSPPGHTSPKYPTPSGSGAQGSEKEALVGLDHFAKSLRWKLRGEEGYDLEDRREVGGSVDTFFYFESALAETSGRKGVESFLPFPSSESLGPPPFQNPKATLYRKLYIKSTTDVCRSS